MPIIERLSALEVLDSRGRPTIRATCRLRSGAAASASVPSGASTGAAEAIELRDGDSKRYCGLGCLRAVSNVCGELNRQLSGREWASVADLDAAMIALDGTPDKSRLGANSILAVSLAFARACAGDQQIPLFGYFARILGTSARLPRLTVNLFSGGKHAGGQVQIQDVLLVPLRATTIDQSLADVFAVYQAAVELTRKRYDSRALVADEGGLAPPFPSAHQMLADATDAIREAGLEPGRDVALAIDVAATHFYRDGRYYLSEQPLKSPQMIEQLVKWVDAYPIVSVEDGLAEEDWENWPLLRRAIGHRAIVLGDDLLCTNPGRIRRAVQSEAANALLLKVNQIGTLTEAAEAHRTARQAGWKIVISARSGETEDDWLADLAVGWAADYIKVGSITRSERLAKYNRLLEIERTANDQVGRLVPDKATPAAGT